LLFVRVPAVVGCVVVAVVDRFRGFLVRRRALMVVCGGVSAGARLRKFGLFESSSQA
jgi:hypothetical protein